MTCTRGIRLGMIVSFAVFLTVFAHGAVTTSAPLKLIRSNSLPGFTGDFDHFAADVKGKRLFLAGEDHKTVEVFDIHSGERLHSITDFGTPHSILYLPESNEIYVTDSDDGSLKIFRGGDYKLIKKVDVGKGADSIGFDGSAKILYIVTGGKDVPLDHSFLVAVDLAARKKLGDLRFESDHVEAMVLEEAGPRLFVNLADKGIVAVVNRKTMQVTDRWPVGVAEQNSPMAFDEPNHRLFIVCRKPPRLVIMDSAAGKLVMNLPTAGHPDDVAFDKDSRRIYVPGSEGYISVFQQRDVNHYESIAKVPSAAGAKTALLVPDLHELFVAVSPGETKAMAKVLTYQVAQ
jgi:DNA-binding beta-propeller fold protein YncE